MGIIREGSANVFRGNLTVANSGAANEAEAYFIFPNDNIGGGFTITTFIECDTVSV